ncbi:MAG: hypothetical protein IJW37_04405, partial [Lachnospiraceae bacterium]|nr:hypothetical protein [Lachnospiraceae bacterium]
VCTLFCLTLLIGCFLPRGEKKPVTATTAVLGNELTLALQDMANTTRRTDLAADVTLFLLPKAGNDADLTELYASPLYGFYLTGEEISYLPEYYASLAEAFPGTEPYIGGLSFTYNPNRLPYNRTTDATLLSRDGTYTRLEKDDLYYVVGTESVFGMFRYLYEQTYHLMRIQPKDATGLLLADYSDLLLRGPYGSYTFRDIYTNRSSQTATASSTQTAGEVFLCRSVNTLELLTQPNIASFFILGSMLLLFTLTVYVRPNLRRIRIWFRIFLIRRKKRGRIPLRDRITTAYTARLAHRRAA